MFVLIRTAQWHTLRNRWHSLEAQTRSRAPRQTSKSRDELAFEHNLYEISKRALHKNLHIAVLVEKMSSVSRNEQADEDIDHEQPLINQER